MSLDARRAIHWFACENSIRNCAVFFDKRPVTHLGVTELALHHAAGVLSPPRVPVP
jgi:hypothetical protein